MENIIYLLVTGIAGLAIGIVIGRFLLRKVLKKYEKQAREKANNIIQQAEERQESIKKEKILEAKEKYVKMKSDFEEETGKKKQELNNRETELKQKEKDLNKQSEQLDRRKAELDSKEEDLNAKLETAGKRKEEYEKLQQEEISKLEKISNLSAKEAEERLIETLQKEAETKASSMVKEIEDEARVTATKKAKKIVIETIQRTAVENAIENTVSVFHIESDDIKGKIIGREGRNIRALEAATGVEIIVDDTPEAIVISGFDPIRREIARLSLHRLVADGRIHPARIEEVVEKTKNHIEEEIVEIGERTVIDLGIHGLHSEIVKLVGRMRFRSSYGQNLLQHSRETAKLCATMAAELGLNSKLAKRAGLLHDIGKVLQEESEDPHAIAGMKIAQQYNENEEVCNAIGAHHDEVEMTSMLSPIIQVCDAISGSRPGARREVVESYLQRLRDLENIALEFEGVNKCFAIQAGRELRVMVDAEKIQDDSADQLAHNISKRIENEMQYPGQVKVTVIREMRSISYAK